MKSIEVNCEPWSVLKMSGLPCRASASSTASMQNAASRVIDSRQDRTRRLNLLSLSTGDDGGEIDEAARHGNVGDVHRPDLVGPGDGQIAEQVRVDPVPRRRLRGVRTPVERLDPHLLHQRGDVTPADPMSLPIQEPLQHSASRKRVIEMQFVDPAHQRQVAGGNRPGQIVDTAPADPQNPGLTDERKIVAAVNHFLALGNPALLSAPAKKSFSRASSPILA